MVKKINCLKGLLDLLAEGRVSGSDKSKCTLLQNMIKESYFFSKKIVADRHKKIISMLEKINDLNLADKIPVRYSSKCGNNSVYFNAKKEKIEAPPSRKEFRKKSVDDVVLYKFNDSYIPIEIDYDGNASVRKIIKRKTGYKVSLGKNNDILYATISHIWGNASNPVFFTNLWNVVIVPTYLNPLLDKNESENIDAIYSDTIKFVKNSYKKICYDIYNMKDKLAEYKKMGFDCDELIAVESFKDVAVDKDVLNNLRYLHQKTE